MRTVGDGRLSDPAEATGGPVATGKERSAHLMSLSDVRCKTDQGPVGPARSAAAVAQEQLRALLDALPNISDEAGLMPLDALLQQQGIYERRLSHHGGLDDPFWPEEDADTLRHIEAATRRAANQ